MTGARELFDARAELGATPIARGCPVIVKNVLEMVGRSRYPDLAAQITARMPTAGNGGWRALPAVSAALAVLARLAGHGDAACRAYEQTLRPGWTVLAGRAPHLVTIDLVL